MMVTSRVARRAEPGNLDRHPRCRSADGWRCGLARGNQVSGSSSNCSSGSMRFCRLLHQPSVVVARGGKDYMSDTSTALAVPPLLGRGLEVPVVGGGTVHYTDLDNAASTPPLVGVMGVGARVYALVRQCAPGRRVQIAGGDGGVRVGPSSGPCLCQCHMRAR